MALPDYAGIIGNGGFDVSGNYYRPRYTPQTMPNYTAGHPYLDPNYSYGADPSHVNTMYFDIAANQDPQAYYAYWLANAGYDDNSQQSKLARGLFDRYTQGYSAAQLISPELKWTDYLSQQNIGRDIGSLSYENQGIDVGRYQGRDRWGLRSG